MVVSNAYDPKKGRTPATSTEVRVNSCTRSSKVRGRSGQAPSRASSPARFP